MEEKQKAIPDELDAEKIVECLKICATGSYLVCAVCPYRTNCNQLIVDAIALLEKGIDLKEKSHV